MKVLRGSTSLPAQQAGQRVHRVAQADRSSVFLASDFSVHLANLDLSQAAAAPAYGAGAAAVPSPLSLSLSELPEHTRSSHAVQALSSSRLSGDVVLGLESSDAHSSVLLSSADRTGTCIHTRHVHGADNALQLTETWQTALPTCRSAGFNKATAVADTTTAAISQNTAQLSIFKRDAHERTFSCLAPPRDVCAAAFGPGKECVFVAEGPMVAVWDVRQAKPVRHEHVSKDVLNSVSAHGQRLCVAGNDRSVYVLDMRSWNVVGSWKGSLKYEAGFAFLSAEEDGISFAASNTDAELASGFFGKGRAKHQVPCPLMTQEQQSRLLVDRAFRSDARWIGAVRCWASDEVFGMTSSGSVYYVQGLQHGFASKQEPSTTTTGSPAAKKSREETTQEKN